MRKNEKVCFISGKFNVLHPGHLRLFRHAKEIADQLVVGVFSDSFDSSGEFMVPEIDRLEGVRANRWVDQVIRVSSLSVSIASLRPDIVLKGKEHETRYNEEEPLLTKYGGTLKFAGGDTRLSSSALLRSESNFESVNLRNAERFLNRHGLNSTDLVCSAENLASVRTLVLGDLIVDRYVDCQPIGLSAEDPTVVVSPLAEEKFVGGAGIVSAHAASFGSNAIFISVRGDDDVGVYADDELQRMGVETNIFVDSDRPTTQKTRYRANGKTLLRINEFRDHQLDKSISEQVIALTKDKIKEVDLIIAGASGWDETSNYSQIQGLRFLGKVSDQALNVLYAEAEAFVYPSLDEGFGLPILESFYHGTPVITSNLPVLIEVAGNAAELVNPVDITDITRGIALVLNEDKAEQQKRLQRMIIRMHMFSWHLVAEQTVEVYKKAIERLQE